MGHKGRRIISCWCVTLGPLCFEVGYFSFGWNPVQVIKGWTEAMQLMVQGDKWEMYIPYELAYGASGKPPKIPAAACLIFIMEICKIKGAYKETSYK